MTTDVGGPPSREQCAEENDNSGAKHYARRATATALVAERFADIVDRDGRFPHEAFVIMKEQKLLGVMVPKELGGEGAQAADIAEVCSILGRACASTGLIYAMHQVKVACLVRHARGNAWQAALQKRIAKDQLLLASSTTEGMGGGNVRSSEAAILRDGGRVLLDRQASVISYGASADGIVTTARRSEAAASSDQVLVVFLRENYKLEPTLTWDTLGMRGTASVGYRLLAEGEADQILPEPYERIHSATMVPHAHMFWSAAWHGVAAGAVQRARTFVRAAARASGGKTPPAAAHLTRARVTLETLRGAIQSSILLFERHAGDPSSIASTDLQLSLNFLKVEASELAVSTVLSAMRACGLSGYRNDSEFSLGRYLRDILSSPIMISNDRILADADATVLMSEIPTGLSLS